jgi:hypothetical protein
MNKLNDLDTSETSEYVIYNKTNAPEIYVDGMSNMMLGFHSVKMSLHSVVDSGSEETKEIRKVVATLTMDTAAAIDMAFDILESCKFAEAGLMDGAATIVPARLRALFDRIPEGFGSDFETKNTVKDAPASKSKKSTR